MNYMHWIFLKSPFKNLLSLYKHAEEVPYAVVDDQGKVWELHRTRLECMRRVKKHRKMHMYATNH